MEQLNPEKLLFHSFTHSQGDISLQKHIFQFVLREADIDLARTAKDCDTSQYVRYLSSGKQHVPPDSSNPNMNEDFVLKQVTSMLSLISSPPGGGKNTLPPDIHARKMASEIITLERIYIKQGAQNDSRPALQKRLLGRRPSFLLYHGRDAYSTTIPLYDEMYSQIWKNRPKIESFDLPWLIYRSIIRLKLNST